MSATVRLPQLGTRTLSPVRKPSVGPNPARAAPPVVILWRTGPAGS